MSIQNHFWAGSRCNISGNNKPSFPKGVIGASDFIRLIADLGNQIPDKSWMLYMLELFIDNRRNVPLELDIICQFDNQNYFEAIFGGYNQYRFSKVLPEVGHSYKREIIVDPKNRVINYSLTDVDNHKSESYQLGESNVKHPSIQFPEVEFECSMQFTGIEWWNKVGTYPYAIRYHVEFSLLRYAQGDASKRDKITFLPYNSATPDIDNQGKQYPISFQNPRIMDGCICYNINSGTSSTGLTYHF